ncbi:MAG: Pr6Pr family membrane protein [Chitinophagaceae bacterium]
MLQQFTKIKIIYAFITALLCWFALVLQLYLIIEIRINTSISISGGVIKFFSFFTILSNLLVALSLTAVVFFKNSFFAKTPVISGITAYIIIVGIIYSLLLKELWNPQGLQLIADIILHEAIPILYFIFWLLFVQKGFLKWKYIFLWLIFPFFYLIWTFLRGALIGEYPYPFVDVSVNGYQKVFINSFLMFILFVIMGTLIVAIDKLMAKSFLPK